MVYVLLEVMVKVVDGCMVIFSEEIYYLMDDKISFIF